MRVRTQMLSTGVGLLLVACGGGDSFSPSVDTVSGAYHATTLTATQGLITSNFLQSGGFLNVTLNSDGTTSGRLFLPGASETGGDLDVDLAGTWSLTGSRVSFVQQGDTFIRDVPFTASRNSLTADSTFNQGSAGEFRIRAVLVK
jgi:hypothetical protein